MCKAYICEASLHMMSFRGRAQTIARNTCSQLGKDMLCHVELCKSFGCMHVIVYMVSCTSVQFMYL